MDSGSVDHRADDDRPRCHHRQHRSAFGPAGSRLFQRPASMDHHCLLAGIRWFAAAGRQAERSLWPQTDVDRRFDRLCGGLRHWRRGAIVSDAERIARIAGRLRGAAGAGGALVAFDDVYRARGTEQGVRHLRWRAGGGRVGWSAARRCADRIPRLAGGHVRQCADRHHCRRRRDEVSGQSDPAEPAAYRHCRRVDGFVWTLRRGLRVLPCRIRRMGR